MQFCDLKCVHASTPKQEMDGSRSCMTFTAIWCELLGRHVSKSQPCKEKIERRMLDAKCSVDSNTNTNTKP